MQTDWCSRYAHRLLTMCELFDGRHKEVLTDVGEDGEDVECDDDLNDDGASCQLLLREEDGRKQVSTRLVTTLVILGPHCAESNTNKTTVRNRACEKC